MTESIAPEAAGPSTDVAATLGLNQQGAGRSRRTVYMALGVLVLVIPGIVWFLHSRSAHGTVSYQFQDVVKGTLSVTVSATGTLQPTNKVEVGSEISGTIKSVEVDYNQRVKRGDVLVRIDTTRQEAQVKQTAASLEAAKAKVLQAGATVSEAKAKLARLVQVQEASGGKVPSLTEMDAARATVDRAVADQANARAAVTQAEASLDAQRIDLAKSVIRSPINGIVLIRAAEPGQTVAASLQTPVLFTLAEDLTRMELQVDVDEADVGTIAPGQSATFTVAAYPDRTFPARVSQVRFGSTTVAGVVTYTTVLTVDNSALLLRPGMTGTASINVRKVENALLVPNTALRFTPPAAPVQQASGGGSLISKMFPRPPRTSAKAPEIDDKAPHVWIVRNGELQKVAVTTGLTDGVKTEVTSGVSAGLPVVVDLSEAK